ncbi:hypothetical protein BHM03_00037806 [Ensete ventricosum]|nr:hypothetical protein BHM03_00037806 [Ensete ventricosum]
MEKEDDRLAKGDDLTFSFLVSVSRCVLLLFVVGWRRCVLHGTRSSYVRIVEALDTTYVKRKLEGGGGRMGCASDGGGDRPRTDPNQTASLGTTRHCGSRTGLWCGPVRVGSGWPKATWAISQHPYTNL